MLLSINLGLTQMDVVLKINHKLGIEDFELEKVSTNNLGHDFKATRLEYYLTRISIVHDGGLETVVPDDVVALVRPEDEIFTTIELGSFDLESIEGIKFHIGVFTPVNNEDPSLWPFDHPLAPKSPSMHWGWAAGYRFIAYEGFGGEGFSQNFQLHGLGNSNYFEVEANVWSEIVDDYLEISLNGNYAAGLNDIDLTSGTISHGETGDAKKVLENWRDVVFGIYTVGLEEIEKLDFELFPNPTSKEFSIKFSDENGIVKKIEIFNTLGSIVHSEFVTYSGDQKFSLSESGVYYIGLLNEKGETIARQKLIVK